MAMATVETYKPNKDNLFSKVAGVFRNSAEYLKKHWEGVLYGGLSVGFGTAAFFAFRELGSSAYILPGIMKLMPIFLIAAPATLAVMFGIAAYSVSKKKET